MSDHSLITPAMLPILATAMGAEVIEKHLTLSRADGGPDSGFSLEPDEFTQMVDAVRLTKRILGEDGRVMGPEEMAHRALRRSLHVLEDISAGEPLTSANVGARRPEGGLAPSRLGSILGLRAVGDLSAGEPLTEGCFHDG